CGVGGGAGKGGGAAGVAQGAIQAVPACVVFGAVVGGGAQAEVVGVGAAGVVAAVAQDGIGQGAPTESVDDAEFELVGVQVRWDGTAAGESGQAGCTEGAVSGGGDRADPGPTLVRAAAVALGLEPLLGRGVGKPDPPQLGWGAHRARVAEQGELLGVGSFGSWEQGGGHGGLEGCRGAVTGWGEDRCRL